MTSLTDEVFLVTWLFWLFSFLNIKLNNFFFSEFHIHIRNQRGFIYQKLCILFDFKKCWTTWLVGSNSLTAQLNIQQSAHVAIDCLYMWSGTVFRDACSDLFTYNSAENVFTLKPDHTILIKKNYIVSDIGVKLSSRNTPKALQHKSELWLFYCLLHSFLLKKKKEILNFHVMKVIFTYVMLIA